MLDDAKLADLKKQAEEAKRNRIPRLRECYESMKPFEDIDDIPSPPRLEAELYEDIVVKNLIRCGAIPKDKLVVGRTYMGSCRNASEAVWLGNEFEYMRTKFGYTYPEKINHFQDDDGYDLFIPLREKEA